MKLPVVTHTRLVAIAGVHSRDGTLALQRLVQRGHLIALDRRRPVTYGIPAGALTSRHVDLFGGVEESLAAGSGAGLQDKVATLQAGALTLVADTAIVQDNPASSEGNSVTLQAEPVTLNDMLSTLNDRAATLQAERLTLVGNAAIMQDKPLSGQGNSITLQAKPTTLAAGDATQQAEVALIRRRANDPRAVEAAILEVSSTEWRTAAAIGALVDRSPQYVRNRYLPRIVADGRLVQRNPWRRTRPA